MSISSKDTEKLFRQFRHSISAPIRQIEVTDEMLCTYWKLQLRITLNMSKNG
jgi:hypothetical protein